MTVRAGIFKLGNRLVNLLARDAVYTPGNAFVFAGQSIETLLAVLMFVMMGIR